MLFGPTLAAMCTSVCCFQKEFSKGMQALQRSLFDSGELAVTSLSHSRASRLWVWLYTRVKLGSMLVYRRKYLRDFYITPTDVGVVDLSRRHTCVGHTRVLRERGRKTRNKRASWVGKENKTSNIGGNK